MEKLKWFIVDKEYINYLRTFESKIESCEYNEKLKPYIGIVLKVENNNYYIPVSSPKAKHYTMKESMDFIKIVDKNKSLLGVLNLNNMIPVLNSQIKELKYEQLSEFRKFKNTVEKKAYISLLAKELKIINSRMDKIKDNATKLYRKKIEYPKSKLAIRSCDFKLLEEKSVKYKKE